MHPAARPPIFQFWSTPGCRIKCPFYTVGHRLGGNFGPKKNICPPPPPNFPQTPSRPLAPPPPPAWRPPLLGFSVKISPPQPRRLGLPLPLPRAEKNKNIRNVHQAEKTQRFFIGCVIKCRFDATSDAQPFWKITVVVVGGSSLIREAGKFSSELWFA